MRIERHLPRRTTTFVAVSALAFLLTLSTVLHAATYYVWTNSPANGPGTAWTNAFHDIQSAIDAAPVGSLVLVTNGVYDTGGRVVYGTMTNRIAIAKAVTVQSVNGTAVTTITGLGWDSAVRCAYITNGAVLVGFTLTHGGTRSSDEHTHETTGGGVWCELGAILSNCVLSANSAVYGGGAYRGTLNNCTITNNLATYGGGVYGGTNNNCAFTVNWAYRGGGAYGSTLNDCTITDNSAYYGGGASDGYLNNCTLTGNSADCGAGTSGGTLNNCALSGNSAGDSGGGASGGTLNNCSLCGNSADLEGGGASGANLNNCIVYYNTARNGGNWRACALSHCCTEPLPIGTGNITNAPMICGKSKPYLLQGSPCIDAGNNAYASGADLDGQPRVANGSVDIGCYEYPTLCTGVLTVAMQTQWTNITSGFNALFEALIEGRPQYIAWQWGDGTRTTNLFLTSHSYAAPGSYDVVLTVSNQSGWVSCTTRIQVVTATIRYVNLEGGNVSPFVSWANAASTIQDAVDVALPGETVLVSNGVYATGGRAVHGTLTNRIAITKPITVRSVNGVEVTTIRGAWHPVTTNGDSAVRCAYVTNGAVLVGFTLTNGATHLSGDLECISGGGVLCESECIVSNCTIAGNSAWQWGGGSFYGTLNNCTLTANSAYSGGGSYGSTLNDCTLTANSADECGGGCVKGTLINCKLSHNSALRDGGGAYGGCLSNCTLTTNSAGESGGGCFNGTLNNCNLSHNSAEYGGGAAGGTLNNCTIAHNSAIHGGGAANGIGCTLNNCALSGNSAQSDGGGSYGCTLNNCTLSGNLTLGDGGGARSGYLNNCTITSNSADCGGGVWGCGLRNCIVYYNTAQLGTNWQDGVCSYSCTVPMPNGEGNITNDPMFVASDNLRLTDGSPCIDTGNNAYAQGTTDLDGRTRVSGTTVDMGAYEWQNDPFIDITNADNTVTYDTATCQPAGVANVYVVGTMIWTNTLTTGWGDFPATTNWLAPQITLSVGTNVVRVSGTNMFGSAVTDSVTVVRGPPGSGTPAIDITNINDSVTFDRTTYAIGGNANANAVGMMFWTNHLVGINGLTGASPTWEVSAIALSVGTNLIEIQCTNVFGAIATDVVVVVRGGVGTGMPIVDITNLNTAVGSTTEAVSVGGTNNIHVCGFLFWTNALTGGKGSTVAISSWQIFDIPVGVGVNPIVVEGSNVLGVLAKDTVTVTRIAVRYVSTNGLAIHPYTNWSSAATNIQYAIDAAELGDMVLVSNGVYDAGGRAVYGNMTNRVVIDKAITVQSVNGPEVTLIKGRSPCGSGAVRCVYVTNGAVLSGFTLTNGCTLTAGDIVKERSAGGTFCEANAVVTNCIYAANTASWYGGGTYNGRIFSSTFSTNSAFAGAAAYVGTLSDCRLFRNKAQTGGGGAYNATLVNCMVASNSAGSFGGGGNGCTIYGSVLWRNSATTSGGGTYQGSLNNCVLAHNSALSSAGGTDGSTLTNCIIYYNTAPSSPNHDQATLAYCCTTPLPAGQGNITDHPLFVATNVANYRLQSGSPCIDTGTNLAWMSTATDLDGRPRMIHNRVDMGAYETILPQWDTDGDDLPDFWEWQFTRTLTAMAAHADADSDGADNLAEFIADTNPTNPASWFGITAVSNRPPLEVYFSSSSGRVYTLEFASNLVTDVWTNIPGQSLIAGPGGSTSLSNVNSSASSNTSYRVKVALP